MKSRNWTLFVFAGLFAFAGCGDDDVCTDCSCDPSLCDGGGGDGDAEANSDSEVPTTMVTLRVETWTLSSDGTPRDLPGADAEVDGQHCTTPCDLELPVGDHELSLSMPGWVQGPNPLEINLTTEGVVVNGIPTSIVEVSGLTLRHRLEKDTTGRWRRESDGSEDDVTVRPPRYPYMCPDSMIVTGPFSPLGALCIEGETLTYCKTHSVECGRTWAAGRIMEDGRRVEFCELLHDQTYPDDCVAPYPLVYLRVD